VASGERKNFIVSLASLIYIAQVSLPKKDWFFRFYDTNQNPVFRTASITKSVTRSPRKNRTPTQQPKIRSAYMDRSVTLQPRRDKSSDRTLSTTTDLKEPKKNRDDIPKISISNSVQQNRRAKRLMSMATPDQVIKREKELLGTPRAPKRKPKTKKNSKSTSTAQFSKKELKIQILSVRDSSSEFKNTLPEYRLLECWNRLEAIAAMEEK